MVAAERHDNAVRFYAAYREGWTGKSSLVTLPAVELCDAASGH